MRQKLMVKKQFILMAVCLTVVLCLPAKIFAELTIQSSEEIMEELDPQIQQLKTEIENHQKSVEDLQKQQAVYEESLKIKRREIGSLRNQLGILDDSMAKLELEIKTNQLEIEQTNLEMQNLQLQLDNKVKQIADQQQRMAEVVRTIDKIDRKQSHMEILVIQGTLSGFFKELNEMESLQDSLQVDYKRLNQLKNELQQKKENLEARKKQLDALNQKLVANQERLDGEKYSKSNLLSETKGQESNYQKLLADVKAEQSRIESEIQSLEVEARRRILENNGILPSDNGFIWPVSSRNVTATFHDPDYPFRYIFEHPAIDIGSVPQSTPIRAARSGYVATVKSNGTSQYGYILLVHTGGLSTVYGHISRSLVKQDAFVVQGEIIALSGGSPGSAGSGRLTTGPHLHFEVRLNGIPVDPLKYLP